MSDEKVVFHPVDGDVDLGVDVQADKSAKAYRDGMDVLEEIHQSIGIMQATGAVIKEMAIDKERARKLHGLGLWGKRAEQVKRGFSDGWYDNLKKKSDEHFEHACGGGVAMTMLGPIAIFIDSMEGIRVTRLG